MPVHGDQDLLFGLQSARYKPAMREQIRAVMRWAGPRMLPVHPVLSVKHVAVTLKAKREAQKTDA